MGKIKYQLHPRINGERWRYAIYHFIVKRPASHSLFLRVDNGNISNDQVIVFRREFFARCPVKEFGNYKHALSST